jgi:hypothetical protein
VPPGKVLVANAGLISGVKTGKSPGFAVRIAT